MYFMFMAHVKYVSQQQDKGRREMRLYCCKTVKLHLKQQKLHEGTLSKDM